MPLRTAALLQGVVVHALCHPCACSLQVREKIETSGRDARWEFSKATLFARSNYMAEVCGHLSEMVEIVDDFFKFLGPELKAVTGAQAVAAVWVQALSARLYT
jgi:dynein heavy chain